MANWDNASRAAYLGAGRALVKAAHPRKTPLVVDPCAGGASIPLEALRPGCEARIDLSVTVDRRRAGLMGRELRRVVDDLGLKDRLRVRRDGD